MRIRKEGDKRSRIVSIRKLADMMGFQHTSEDDSNLFIDILENIEDQRGKTKNGVPFVIEEFDDVPNCPICYEQMRKVRYEPGLYKCRACKYYERVSTDLFFDMESYLEDVGLEDEFVKAWMKDAKLRMEVERGDYDDVLDVEWEE